MGCTSSTEIAAASGAPPSQTKSAATPSTKSGDSKTRQEKSNGTPPSETMATASSNHENGGSDNTSSSNLIHNNGVMDMEAPPGNITCESSSKVVIGEFKLRYGCCSQRGRDPESMNKPNQDSFSVHHDNFLIKGTKAALFGVYDGHGPQGEKCSQFTQQRLPELAVEYLEQHIHVADAEQDDLNLDDLQEAMFQAHTKVNRELRKNSTIDDSYSGTTSISVLMNKDNRITVCNVGDSRAVLGTTLKGSLQAVALSKDQTPRRPDEAKRCELAGARILSFGQIDPSTKGEDDDDVDDPPRVWSMKGHFPGTAFTRSIGDGVAETLGVNAEPEMLTVKMTSNEQVIILASDGIYDVMGNDQVVNIAYQHKDNPLEACHAIIDKAHQEWLLNDDCTEESASYDDMTVVCIFLDDGKQHEVEPKIVEAPTEPAAPGSTQERKKRVRQKTLRNLEEMKL